MFGKVRAWSRRHEKLAGVLRVAPLATLCAILAIPYAAVPPATAAGPYFGVAGYLALSAALLLPLLWRERAVASFAVIALISFGQWLAGVNPLPANLAVLVALWAVAYRCSFRWSLAAGLVTELGVFLALARWDTPTLGMFFSGSIFTVTVWLTGLYASTRRRYLEGLEERAERAERERDQQARMAAAAERARIARELHDVVAHNVSVMVVQADGAGYALDSDPEQAREAVRAISKTGRAALAEMRRLVGVLREGEQESTDYTPQPGLGQLEDLVRGSAVPTRLQVGGAPVELPEGQQLAVYRIVQEALTNALKHGGPGVQALVEIDYSGPELVVRVTDDGRGAAAPRSAGGHGLIGMRERVGMYGGAVSAEPLRDGGFEVLARLPMVKAA
ncbi:sensor histidine kinase [Nonomuraea angiospora]|uniref:histidine kinase n=1 Tax=Nonomuraea angiospora TaxID=46172 RepID=A0ABR9ME17_9ACTN|nr:histidine kinase [Nonomuraea angiospora]MBE1590830.1 signal transduction histidine kinase [Nonomuraea angiospora]